MRNSTVARGDAIQDHILAERRLIGKYQRNGKDPGQKRTMATVLFLHGWTSKPGGLKPTYLAEHGHTVINPALPDEDFAESVRIAQAEVDRHHPDVVVGSSRGGAVAMNVDTQGAALVLLCPAWKKWGTATTVKPGTVILHSEADDIVPIVHSRELVARSGLPVTALVIVGNDHRLAEPEPLAALVVAVERTNCDRSSPYV
jgi:alpha-beta hydrolase superfamily lysophospholipase